MNDYYESMRRKASARQEAKQERDTREKSSEFNQRDAEPRKRKEREQRQNQKEDIGNMDIKVNLEVAADELLEGCTKEFIVQKTVDCECRKSTFNATETERLLARYAAGQAL